MNKVFAVIRREFIERVRTKSFLIGTFLVPLLVGAFGYLPALLAKRDTASKTIVVLDAASGPIGQVITSRLGADSIGAAFARGALAIGYAILGEVTSGMDVVDAIAAAQRALTPA